MNIVNSNKYRNNKKQYQKLKNNQGYQHVGSIFKLPVEKHMGCNNTLAIHFKDIVAHPYVLKMPN